MYDMRQNTWSHASAALPGAVKLVAVRHACCAVADSLYVIGGGAMCFSFGSTFCEVPASFLSCAWTMTLAKLMRMH